MVHKDEILYSLLTISVFERLPRNKQRLIIIADICVRSCTIEFLELLITNAGKIINHYEKAYYEILKE